MIVFLIPHALPIASLKQRDNPPIANKDFFYLSQLLIKIPPEKQRHPH
ncbi:hypothetical protein [Helicobacter pylori]|nr:hypothetical protein [Helicobacter pylori]EJC12023.1 hypothetical protein HPHPP25_1664 [Helicobacter pylori Hp P-25]EJC33276.1 hypothetical protein HPHPP25C_1395 [Helicobacter pylori Hp P-25c]EJC38956.1 hypothetical protein HPHPP25D_0638 [Helicobacter pylori Hp P-25d]EJC54218.1 hypothetical protein HPHPP62_1261 [Helicobacter pylori Hp P-62]EMG89243.1 hypothetical protein HMPREF1397_00567 [Helicobacter pylori GAM115Ai]